MSITSGRPWRALCRSPAKPTCGVAAEGTAVGGFSADQVGALARIFASPGPIFDPEARRIDD
jgi:hypothetical protein